jgi:hypothetical protein
MTSCRVRQRTKKQSAKKALASVKKEMALPRVVQSAQKTIGDAATIGIPRRDSFNFKVGTSTSTCMARMGE